MTYTDIESAVMDAGFGCPQNSIDMGFYAAIVGVIRDELPDVGDDFLRGYEDGELERRELGLC